MDDRKRGIIESMRGLIVSCQSQPDDPIHGDGISTVVMMAKAARWGGAAGLRANTPTQIKAIKEAVDLPVIGLYKIVYEGCEVFITPNLQAAREVWESKAEIIALDCTDRINPEGKKAYELIADIKREMPEAIIFADVSNLKEAINAKQWGADIVAPTLYGYTAETKGGVENFWDVQANFELIADIVKACKDENCYVMMEGHINTPEEAVKCLYLGVDSVVVGSAITRPHTITARFSNLIYKYPKEEGK